MALSVNFFFSDVKRGDLAAVKRGLSTQPGVLHARAGPEQRTPLHAAAEVGNHLVLRTLLQQGADYGAVDAAGEVPLMLAARNVSDAGRRDKAEGGTVFVSGVVAANVCFFASACSHTRTHSTLHTSTLCPQSITTQGHLAVARELLADAGRRACLKSMSKDGSTALHIAAASTQAGVVQLLLDAGARTDVRDRVRKREREEQKILF